MGEVVSSAEYERRKGLSFEQAEGLVPLPTQLDRETISPVLRARFWEFFRDIIHTFSKFHVTDSYLTEPIATLFKDELVYRRGGFVSAKTTTKSASESRAADVFKSGDYIEFYGFIQFLLNHPASPRDLKNTMGVILEQELAAYRVVGGDTLVPVTSLEEARAIDHALNPPRSHEQRGRVDICETLHPPLHEANLRTACARVLPP